MSDERTSGRPVTFPGCDVPSSALGVGTWAWGDRGTWGMGGYDETLSESTITEAWEASIDAGVNLFDTAEVYGDGESERIIGRLLAQDASRRASLVIATKFLPAPWKLDVRRSMRSAALASLERLGVDRIDLYQIHGPVSLRSQRVLADALADLHDDGLISSVGVSNYSASEMRSMHGALARRGLRLGSNQIEFSPLRRGPETSGLLAACAELGVVPLAYSPLGQGRLTGKYSAQNPPPGKRTFSAHPMEQVDRIVAELRRLGEHHDRSPGQVALRWIVQKGAVPIPGAKNAAQARENAGALGWELDAEEMAAVDAVALAGIRSLRHRIWQHG